MSNDSRSIGPSDGWIHRPERAETIPCVLCHQVPPGGTPYTSMDAEQVFLCRECARKVDGEDGLDEELWDLVIERSREARAMYWSVRDLTDDAQ
jgi:hypothetical protein